MTSDLEIEIDHLIELHLKEVERLSAYKEAYRQSVAAIASAVTSPNIDHRITRTSEKTIKEHVVEILRKNPSGLHWSDILNALHLCYSPQLERTSLSPQLSRLKHEGKITLTNGLWSITEPNFLPESPSLFLKKPIRKIKLK